MPGHKRLAGAVAAVSAAVAISACGSSSDNATIPPVNATDLTTALNAVQTAVNNGDCKEAEQRAGDFIDAVNQLPDTVGTEDKDALRSAGENLEKLANDPSQCVPETGTTGLSDQQTTSSTEKTTTSVPTTSSTTTTTSTTSTTEPPAPENGGGNQGTGGGESTDTGGGSQTGGGDGGQTGGGGEVGGGSGGTGGTGTGGTGGGGTG